MAPWISDGTSREIRRQLEVAARAGGDEDVRAVVERLVSPLDAAAMCLALLDALAAAADEITVELAPGSVELRLRGRDPEFVVTPPPADPSRWGKLGRGAAARRGPAWVAADARNEDATISRINLRLPEHLKARIDRTRPPRWPLGQFVAGAAAASALERADPARRRERRTRMVPSATRAGRASRGGTR